jgi:hypothetical protein
VFLSYFIPCLKIEIYENIIKRYVCVIIVCEKATFLIFLLMKSWVTVLPWDYMLSHMQIYQYILTGMHIIVHIKICHKWVVEF